MNAVKKGIIAGLALVAGLAAVSIAAAKGGMHECPHMKGKCASYPMRVEGADVKIENLENGVRITITASDAEAVKAIQAAAVKMNENHGAHGKAGGAKEIRAEKKAVYACPMGDYTADKPGNCPKCGMKLEKK
ncbi:MAG: hypothetical protein HY747_10310 [Elusimicrobia bacterium]|nr:hypothetical protein [Elusimicrobiota bacterium]